MPRLTQALAPLPTPDDTLLRMLPLSERCEQYLRHLLLEGVLAPNQMLSVEAVASVLGVSRQPAMEAVKRLASDGFIVILPQVGCRVAVPEPAHVADFYRVFAPGEALIARLAAERRDAGQAEVFGHLSARIAADASEAGPPAARSPVYRRLNRTWYEAIHAMARSPIAVGIVAGMWDRSDFYLQAAFGSLYFTAQVHRSRAAITAAIVAGDPAAAEYEMREFLLGVGLATAQRLSSSKQNQTTPGPA